MIVPRGKNETDCHLRERVKATDDVDLFIKRPM